MSSSIRAQGSVAVVLAALVACTAQPPEAATAEAPAAPSTPTGFPGGAVSTHVPVELAFLLSGVDLVTLWANGGADTHMGTQLGDRDLGFKLVPGDDFAEQLKRYQSGQTPYLRATWGAVGSVYEQLCPSQEVPTCPQLVLGMGASKDDELLVRGDIKTAADLKGKLISLQRGGPHLEAMFSLLRDSGVAWSDVRILWKERLIGPGSAAEAFSVDTNLSGAWALSRDVPPLLKPTVSEGEALAPAHVLTTSAEHPDLILDCLFVRQDYLAAHPDEVEHLRAGWLHASEQVKALRPGSPESDAFLTAVAGVYGPGVVTDPPAALALLEGATLYGLADNVRLSGDSPDLTDHVDLSERSRAFAEASGRPVWTWTMGVAPTHWGGADFADLPQEAAASDQRVIVPLSSDATAFDPAPYAADLDGVLAALATEGTVLRVRGHVDPQRAFAAALKAGLDSGKVVRGGTDAAPTYTIDGKVLDVTDGKELVAALPVPADVAREARLVATTRAQAVRDGVLAYATAHGGALDAARVQVEGVGVDEPLVGLTAVAEQSAKNRRVELIVVSAGQAGPTAGGW